MSSHASSHSQRAARRREARTLKARRDDKGPSLVERWALPLVVLATFATIIGVVLLAQGGGGTGSSGAGAGGKAPDFSAVDVVSGKTMTLADLQGHRTLLFFSEGASCQSCLVQIADLQRDPTLQKDGIHLISITTDPPGVLASVADQYGIKTPLLSDSSGQMSSAYGMLGRGGMGHPDQDGHAFMLIDGTGRIAWQQAYSQMYVSPHDLLQAMPKGA